jgi:rubrerythrin
MTNEEIIEQLENAIELIKQDGKDWLDDRDIPILEVCIKALEQEQSGDLISRDTVLDAIEELKKIHFDRVVVLNKVRDRVLELQSVKPQEPKTVLYSGDGYADGYMVYDMAECPNCGYEYEDSDKDWGLPFCPNCGQNLNWESEE